MSIGARAVAYVKTDKGNDRGGKDAGGGLCLITSACVLAHNLSDNCRELQLLRKLRDDYLLQTEAGREEVMDYYSFAPAPINHINQHPSNKWIWDLAFDYITLAADLVEVGNYESARVVYYNMAVVLCGACGTCDRPELSDSLKCSSRATLLSNSQHAINHQPVT